MLLIEAVAFFLAFRLSGTRVSLIDNAKDSLRQSLEKRELSLNRELTEQSLSLNEVSTYIDSLVSELDIDESVTEYLNSEKHGDDFLIETAGELLLNMRIHSGSGIFVILSNGMEDKYTSEEMSFKGIYLRNTSNDTNHQNILIERGSEQVFTALGIPMDSYWQPNFRYDPSDERSMEYYFSSFLVAKADSSLNESDYGYWSLPFSLSGVKGSYDVITYTQPLISDSGEVYGVVGIEIPVKKLMSILNMDKSSAVNIGYAVARYDKKVGTSEGVEVMATSGASVEQICKYGDIISFGNTDLGDEIFQLNQRKWFNSDVYAGINDTKLYGNNAVFSDQQWSVIAFTDSNSFYVTTNKVIISIVIAALTALAIGSILIVLTARKITNPIIRTCENVHRISGSYEYLDKTGVSELDELIDAMNISVEKRMNMEIQLREERQRFLTALESSSDILFEYECSSDTLTLYNLEAEEQVQVLPNLSENIVAIVHPDDIHLIEELLVSTENRHIECRIREEIGQDLGYHWSRVSCKPVRDSEDNIVRYVGNMKDIRNEKALALAKEEAMKRDCITGLYNADEAYIRFKSRLENPNITGHTALILIDLDNFTELNGYYGVYHCDVILSQIGRYIKKSLSEGDIASRFGGDEFLILINRKNKNDINRYTERMHKHLSEIYTGENQNLSLSSTTVVTGADKGDSLEFLLKLLKSTIVKEKVSRKNSITYCSKSDFNDDSTLPELKINEIVSKYNSEDYQLSTMVFNIFERANDLRSSINVLLAEIGEQYKLDSIIIHEFDMDFYTSVITNEWYSEKTGVLQSDMDRQYNVWNTGVAKKAPNIKRYTEKEMKLICDQYLNQDTFVIDKKSHLWSHKQSIEGGKGSIGFYNKPVLSYSIIDTGEIYGCIIFSTNDTDRCWTKDEIGEIREIVKIMSAYVVKSKHDLASKAKSDFLSRMSHEIRTPMNAIIGMTHIARNSTEDKEKLDECLRKIDTSTKYLISLINDILDMSKIESGKMTLVPTPNDINQLIDSLSIVIETTTSAKNIRFIIERDISYSSLVFDNMKLNQVLINLLGNAVKFTPEGGSIRLKIEELEKTEKNVTLRFDVIDTGIGISEENRKRIFNSFEQAESTTSLRYGGTGLGLSISSNIVKMMGGSLRVESKLNEGSDFYFILTFEKAEEIVKPAVKPAEVKNNDKDKDDDTPVLSGKRVLIVEDNELNIEIADAILSELGAETEMAENGQIAVDKFSASEANYYDLILMDIRMPVMDGLAATRAIRTLERPDARSVPIVAMSANAFDEDMKTSIDSGMNGHLAKPIDIPKLIETFKALF